MYVSETFIFLFCPFFILFSVLYLYLLEIVLHLHYFTLSSSNPSTRTVVFYSNNPFRYFLIIYSHNKHSYSNLTMPDRVTRLFNRGPVRTVFVPYRSKEYFALKYSDILFTTFVFVQATILPFLLI